MPIDSSMYNQQMPDFLGAVKDGMSIRDLADQRVQRQKAVQEQEKIKAAYQAGVVTKEDGSTSIDPQRQMSALLKVSPQEAQKFQMQQDQMRGAALDRKAKEAAYVSQAFGGVNDLIEAGDMINAEKMWNSTHQQFQKDGIDLGQFANAPFDPKLAKSLYAGALTKRDRLDEAFRRDQLALQKQEAATKAAEARAKANSGEGLGVDKKKTVETLATKNANKISIKNQIDSVMNGWDALSDDQKVAMGGQLLKTLNSPEGADAIGAEEAKRLGSKLQFAMGNFTNSNPTQFGRDLKGFKEQAMNTAKFIGESVDANQAEIDRTMGRKTQSKVETKEWEGVTYKKVGDQWVPQ